MYTYLLVSTDSFWRMYVQKEGMLRFVVIMCLLNGESISCNLRNYRYVAILYAYMAFLWIAGTSEQIYGIYRGIDSYARFARISNWPTFDLKRKKDNIDDGFSNERVCLSSWVRNSKGIGTMLNCHFRWRASQWPFLVKLCSFWTVALPYSRSPRAHKRTLESP